MLGAISGDIIGSIYEVKNIKNKEFTFFEAGSKFTDDSVMTCAVASACTAYLEHKDLKKFKKDLIDKMQEFGLSHINAGYGGRFIHWLFEPVPYNSYGNGSAMRVSPVAWTAQSLEETLELARISAEVSHNHPEGIKGAEAIAGAIYLLRNKVPKEKVKEYILNNYYQMDFTIDGIRDSYKFDVSCQGSVPQAFQSFFEANSFEDTIRNAISIGGDSDTIAAIAGSLAEAYYGVPENIVRQSISYLDEPLKNSVITFYKTLNDSKLNEQAFKL